jgi:hypothetical protein
LDPIERATNFFPSYLYALIYFPGDRLTQPEKYEKWLLAGTIYNALPIAAIVATTFMFYIREINEAAELPILPPNRSRLWECLPKKAKTTGMRIRETAGQSSIVPACQSLPNFPVWTVTSQSSENLGNGNLFLYARVAGTIESLPLFKREKHRAAWQPV